MNEGAMEYRKLFCKGVKIEKLSQEWLWWDGYGRLLVNHGRLKVDGEGTEDS